MRLRSVWKPATAVVVSICAAVAFTNAVEVTTSSATTSTGVTPSPQTAPTFIETDPDRNETSRLESGRIWPEPGPIEFTRGTRVTIGELRIPAIGLREPFYEGISQEVIDLGPGHWPGTPHPGKPGNSVFGGHRSTFTRPFEDLDRLRSGNEIKVRVTNNKWTTYRVVMTVVLPESDYADYVLQKPSISGTKWLTLFACTPKGGRTHRIVVRAVATSL